MSDILKFDFRKRKQLHFSHEKLSKLHKKRHNFACDHYIFPKTWANKNKQWTQMGADIWSWPVGGGVLQCCPPPHLEGELIVRGPKIPKTGGRSTDDPIGDSTWHISSWSMCIFNTVEIVDISYWCHLNVEKRTKQNKKKNPLTKLS